VGRARDAAWKRFGRRWWKVIVTADIVSRVVRVLAPVALLVVAMGAVVALARAVTGSGPDSDPPPLPQPPPSPAGPPPVEMASPDVTAPAAAAEWVLGLPGGVWLLAVAVCGWFALRPWPRLRRPVVAVSAVVGLVWLCAGGCQAVLT
jgi:hypothetical protein